jgi:hypothetical protein
MDQMATERVCLKRPEWALYRELQDDYGLSKIESRALTERILDWSRENHKGERAYNQIVRQVVKRGEKSGKRIAECRLVSVVLTLDCPEDVKIAQERGIQYARETKIYRIVWEAFNQGGTLSQEDISDLLLISPKTVKRACIRLKERGLYLPTRGNTDDIGPGISHKSRIIELLIKGYVYSEIVAYTGHCIESIRRYEDRFVKTVYYHIQKKPLNTIRILTNLSEKLIKEYIALYHKYDTDEYRSSLVKMLARFHRFMTDGEKRGE